MSPHYCTLAALFALLAPVVSSAQPLKLTYNFDESSKGWANQAPLDERSASEWNRAAGRTAGGIHITSSEGDPQQLRPWRCVIPKPPAGKRIRCSVWVKGARVETLASLVVQAHSSNQTFSEFAAASTQTTMPLKGDFDWTRIETTVVVPPDAANLQVLLLLVGNGEVWFDEVELLEVGDAATLAPGTFQVRSKYSVTFAASGVADAEQFIPLPVIARDQVPLGFALTVDPPERLRRAAIEETSPGQATLTISITPNIEQPEQEVVVEWRSLVLIAPSTPQSLSKTAAFPLSWPETVTDWLMPTASVQCGDERIKSLAVAARAGSNDVIEVLDAVLAAASTIIKNQSGVCRSLDAVEALERVGPPTSRANLVVAMLRAAGVPARTIVSHPAAGNSPNPSIFVEAFIPSHGWHLFDPHSPGKSLSRHEYVIVSIVTPEQENRCETRHEIPAGQPYLTTTELAPQSAAVRIVGMIDPAIPERSHVVAAVRNLDAAASAEDWDELIASARRGWQTWLAAKPVITSGQSLSHGLDAREISASTPAELMSQFK